MKKQFAFIAATSLIASAAFAVPFTADFQTNQAANFTVTIASSDNDANANFLYDSSTFAQASGTVVYSIGTAPNAGGTQNVLRLNTNVGTASVDVDAVNVYPNVTGLGSHWSMTWDCWNNYNGDVDGGSGSTNMLIFGATSAKTVAPVALTAPAIAGDGFYFTMTGEGGALADYRFYSGTGTIVANNPAVTWLGGAAGTNLNNLDVAWNDPTTGYFPISASFPTTPYQTAGAPGKAWLVLKLEVNGTAATVSCKRPGDANFAVIGSAAVPATAVNPFIGFSDINTGQASPVADQFVLVDNLAIDNVAGVSEWSLY